MSDTQPRSEIAALLQCAQRHASADHAKVQIAAFEAINDLVRSASRDTLDIAAQLIQVRLRGPALPGWLFYLVLLFQAAWGLVGCDWSLP